MEAFKPMHKVKILDYYSLVETDQAVSPAAEKRIPLKGLCKICFRPIRGSHRVKSNFICHLKRCHPEIFAQFEILSGRKQCTSLSLSSLDDGEGVIGTIDYSNSHTNKPDAVSDLDMNMELGMPTMVPQPSLSTLSTFSSALSASTSTAAPSTSALVAKCEEQNSIGLMVSAPPTKAKGEVIDLTTSSEMQVKLERTGNAPMTTGSSGVKRAHSVIEPLKSSQKKGRPSQSCQQMFNDTLLDLVVGNLISADAIGDSRFHKLIAIARDSHFYLPPTQDFTDLITSRAAQKKKTLQEKLKTIKCLYLSEEPQLPRSDGKTYVNISAHFIHRWTLTHVLLSCKPVNCFADGQYILDTLGTVKSEYAELRVNMEEVVCNLSQHVSLPGFSNASKKENIHQTNGAIRHQSCFTYELGLAIHSSIMDPSQASLLAIVERCAKLLSTKGMDWGPSVNTSANDWYDQLSSLEQMVKLSDTDRQRLRELVPESHLFSNQELNLLKDMLDAVKPFKDVITHFHTAGAATSTSSLVVPYRRLLMQNNAEHQLNASDSFLHVLSQQFVEKTEFVEAGNKRATTYTTATSLDPRFKLQWCEDRDYELYKAHLVSLANKEVSHKHESLAAIKNESTSSVFAKILKQSSKSNEDIAVSAEVERYLQEPLVDENYDVLKYWQLNCQSFPTLSVLAEQYLSVPTSSKDIGHLRPSASSRVKDENITESLIHLRADT